MKYLIILFLFISSLKPIFGQKDSILLVSFMNAMKDKIIPDSILYNNFFFLDKTDRVTKSSEHFNINAGRFSALHTLLKVSYEYKINSFGRYEKTTSRKTHLAKKKWYINYVYAIVFYNKNEEERATYYVYAKSGKIISIVPRTGIFRYKGWL